MWLRWRILKNSVTGSKKRDMLEQVSRSMALVVPVAIASLSIGTFIAVSIVGFLSGRAIGVGLLDAAQGLFVLRILLAVAMFAIIALSMATPTQSATARYTRLLLLPIHRRVLHLVEVASSMADPWLAIIGAGLFAFAIGLLAGGRTGAGLAGLAATLATFAFLVCAGSLAGFLVAWLMRSRRRGELFTLIFVMAFTLVSFIPAFASKSFSEKGQPGQSGRQRQFIPQEFDRRLPVWTRFLPSELHVRVISAGLSHQPGRAAGAIALLLVEAALLFDLSSRVHRRMLNSLEGDSGRKRTTEIKGPSPKLPFLSPGASAVAWAQFRGALRTVRGRLTVLLPGPMLGILMLAFRNVPTETWAANAAEQGYLLLGVSLVFTLYSIHAVSMNLFGSDRAGLTLQLLAPLSDRELAWGKIAGFGMIVGLGSVICLAVSLSVARSGPPEYWIATILAGAATFFLISPLAIWFSALFPVQSDLSKTGAGGNPHPLPMIVGTICTAAFVMPAASLVLASEFYFHSEFAAVVLMVLWLAVSIGIAIPCVNLAARTIAMRRENLALVAQGR